MPQAYSLDLRERVVAHVLAGHSCRSTARHFDVSASFVITLMRQYHATGKVEPARPGRKKGSGKLSPYHTFLRDCVIATPDITLRELSERLLQVHAVSASLWSIARILKSLGFTYKKNIGRL